MAPINCKKGYKIRNSQCIPKYEYNVKYITHGEGLIHKPRKGRVAFTKKITMAKYQKVLNRSSGDGRTELLEFKEIRK